MSFVKSFYTDSVPLVRLIPQADITPVGREHHVEISINARQNRDCFALHRHRYNAVILSIYDSESDCRAIATSQPDIRKPA
jgi:hypothetical protein